MSVNIATSTSHIKVMLPLEDIDGNEYSSIIIGSQQWLVENFKCEHYANGTPISIVEDIDWFLPSKDELNLMYVNLHLEGVGGFLDAQYWSSSEDSSTDGVWQQLFSTGSQTKVNKEMMLTVRACRVFTAEIGAYSLRDIGPSGGLIFYNAGTTYYEAALADQGSNQTWSNITVEIGITAQGASIGTGQTNTAAIIRQAGHTNSAAKLCNDLNVRWTNDTTGAMCYYNNDETTHKTLYGALYNWYAVDKRFDDWFLPSKDELNAMYTELYLEGVGGFSNSYYWSSSETNNVSAWIQLFSTGAQTGPLKTSTAIVRACRSFTSTTVYALRDTGPAGGLIFWKSGNYYLEAAPSDQGANIAWSNITNLAIGTTGTAIGTGQANTTAIIGQVGHTDSAANLCNDLLEGSKLAYLERNGIQEVGWKIATDSDFDTLSTFLGGFTVAGGYLKQAGTSNWDTPNTGATDVYGMTILPAGNRLIDGTFSNKNDSAFLWSSTDDNVDDAFGRLLTYNSAAMAVSYSLKTRGMSVRLMRDI